MRAPMAAPAKPKTWKLRSVLALLMVAALFVIADPRKVLPLIGQANPILIVAGTFSVFAMYFLRSIRWRVLLIICAKPIPVFLLSVWTLAGTLLNFLLPTSIGGDLGRWYLVQSQSVSKAAAGFSLILDRMLGSLAFVPLIALTAIGGLTLPTAIQVGNKAIILTVVTGGLLVAISAFLWRLITDDRGKEKLIRVYNRFFKDSADADSLDTTIEKLRTGRRRDWLNAILLSLAAHLCFVAAEYCFAVAIGIQVSFWQMSFLYLIAATAMLAPISPNGLGIREGLNVWFLTALGNTTEAAFGYSLISLVVRFVTCLPSMLYVDIRPNRPPAEE